MFKILQPIIDDINKSIVKQTKQLEKKLSLQEPRFYYLKSKVPFKYDKKVILLKALFESRDGWVDGTKVFHYDKNGYLYATFSPIHTFDNFVLFLVEEDPNKYGSRIFVKEEENETNPKFLAKK